MNSSRPAKRFGRHIASTGFTLVELMVVVAILSLLVTILLPTLWRAREITRSTLCLTNLHGLGRALHTYTFENDGYYPLAYHTERVGRVRYNYAWDITHVMDWDTREETITAGTLWQGMKLFQIQQCPSYKGSANWMDDPFTGYNYNTSYLGYNERSHPAGAPPKTVTIYAVKYPGQTAAFGDGEYQSGTNKFMRAPWRDAPWDTFVGRSAGTQGYRHLGKTNVCWADGHATHWAEKHRQTHPDEMGRIPEDEPYGYLSADNSLYDLK